MARRLNHRNDGATELGPVRLLAVAGASAFVALAVLTGLVVAVVYYPARQQLGFIPCDKRRVPRVHAWRAIRIVKHKLSSAEYWLSALLAVEGCAY